MLIIGSSTKIMDLYLAFTQRLSECSTKDRKNCQVRFIADEMIAMLHIQDPFSFFSLW